MLAFAYDGSLNGDWIAHYAVRFAAHAPERRIRILHVCEREPDEAFAERVARIRDEGAILGVESSLEVLRASTKSVAERLLEATTDPATDTLLCGARAKPRNLAFLAGTVAAALLERARPAVVAIRVVHPGVLGQPGKVLLPLAGHPDSARRSVAFLRLLGPDLARLHVLMVREVSHLRFRTLSARAADEMLAEARRRVAALEREIRAGLSGRDFAIDSSVVVSDDAPKEILVHAGRLRSRLICLGASERTLPERLVYGNPIEQILREAPCDVAIHRSAT